MVQLYAALHDTAHRALSLARFEKVVATNFCGFATAKYVKCAKTELNKIRSRTSRGSRFTIFHFEKSVFHPCPSAAKISP